ncbi:MAG: hypothetical protein Hals2KO_35170 [Halioglobus sp.]
MQTLTVHGPHDIPCYTGKAGRAINTDGIPMFWEKHKPLASHKGCYVFGIRAGRGYTPIYVGKATKSFRQECFTYHKLSHYHRCLIDYARGTPVMFFVVLPSSRGRTNNSVISDVEGYLIALGETANPRLSNVQGRSNEKWGIRGVVRGGKGKTNSAVSDFKTMMGL